MAKQKIDGMKLLALILMLIPFVSIIGFVIYILRFLNKGSLLELIVCILTIPFGLFAAIFLWLNALGIIKL